jgi:hypothetical protein
MAEFHYATCVAEAAEMVESFFSRGDVYAIEKSLKVPRPEDAERFRSVREEHLERWNSRVFVTLFFFGDYSLFAPQFWFSEESKMHWPASLEGGPYIGITFTRPRRGRVLFGDDNIFTESFYMIPEEHRVPGGSTSLTKEQLAPMREAYKDFVKRAKRILVRHTLKGSDIKVWIGRESLQRVEAGELCLSWGDRHYSAGTWREGKWPPDVLAIMQAE